MTVHADYWKTVDCPMPSHGACTIHPVERCIQETIQGPQCRIRAALGSLYCWRHGGQKHDPSRQRMRRGDPRAVEHKWEGVGWVLAPLEGDPHAIMDALVAWGPLSDEQAEYATVDNFSDSDV